jgi:CheY-like chemotaxis protein/HPt (histidine-containing phosphotransfer) domain-containing protein
VTTASNGREAIDAVINGAYDIVLMDVQMPVMDGIQATKIIRATADGKRDTPIIALTAAEMVSNVQECIQAGMNDFVSKPFSVQQLVNVIESIFEKNAKNFEDPAAKLDSNSRPKLLVLDTETALINCNNDIIIYKRMLREFMNTLPEKSDKISIDLAGGEKDGASRLVHNLKGVSATLGAMKFSQAAAQLESAIELGDGDAIGKKLQNFRDQITLLKSQVETYLNEI